MYWEAGWSWDNLKDGGYGGIQARGILADGSSISDLAIFSIWNGISAIPGTGAGCRRFDWEGIGFTCSIPISLIAGNKYEITFGVDQTRGPQWWNAYISDFSNGTKMLIGSIETNSNNARATNWNNFVEYWGPAVPCDAVGSASAKFYVPTSSNADVEVSNAKFSRPAQGCVSSAGDTPPPGFIGDAIIRFGGAQQAPSTQTMPYIKTKVQLAAEKAAAEVKEAADLKAKQDAEAKALADKALADKVAADARAAEDKLAAEQKAKQEEEAKALAEQVAADAKAAGEKIIANAKSEAAKILATAKAKAAAAKKKTITCVKGKLTKKVTAVKPVCPKGYRKK